MAPEAPSTGASLRCCARELHWTTVQGLCRLHQSLPTQPAEQTKSCSQGLLTEAYMHCRYHA